MKVTYYGQACTLIEVSGRRILTDPWLTETAYFGTWYHTHLLADANVSPASVCKEDIDYLFLSHEHLDHFDEQTLREFRRDIPILICKFRSPRFRRHVESLGFTNIRELQSGECIDLGGDLKVTVFMSAEYTNDSAIFVEGEGHSVFNETDCKLSFEDLERVRSKGISIGFYMFSGANWYPIMYDYPPDVMQPLIRRRRSSLVKSFVKRVELTRPAFAVPSAGPCTVLDPDLLHLNTSERGIFIDPEDAKAALIAAKVPGQPLVMAATDVWDSRTGPERRSPDRFQMPRQEYIANASARLAPEIRHRKSQEAPAGSDLGERVVDYFNTRVGAQTPEIRRRINAKMALVVEGPQGGEWTVDFTASGPGFVREGVVRDWTYRIQVEDKLLYPFVTGQMEFLEDLFLSLRVRFSRQPDVYNDPLYNFLYDPDPRRLHAWYAHD
jgi:hypothetical protein